MKQCFKCGETKPLTEFYAHPQMADGRLGKCKACAKEDVRANYAARREQYSAYEQERHQRPERKAAKQEGTRRYRERHPDRHKAHSAVSNAIRDGRLERGPCAHCGTTEKVQAHHHDYSRPLDVTWACFKCHREHEHGQVVSVVKT